MKKISREILCDRREIERNISQNHQNFENHKNFAGKILMRDRRE